MKRERKNDRQRIHSLFGGNDERTAIEEMKKMKTYKGFNKDMTCIGYQYEEGKEYETNESVICCNSGFHACEYPLDCFRYYAPSESVYHEVEQSGEISKNTSGTKVASSKIKIGAAISIAGLVKASFEYIKARADKTKSNHSKAANKVNSATGDGSANSATGYGSANSATGYRSANSATGYGSANSATGDRSANSATGYGSANSATGYGSANISTGRQCKNVSGGVANISVGWGKDNKCKGVIGSYLVLSEWGEWDGYKYPLLGAQMVIVDGKQIKEDIYYTLKYGKIVEAENEKEAK